MAIRSAGAVVGFFLAGAGSLAADLPARTAPPAPPPVIVTGWAGPYAGFHWGYARGPKSSLSTTASATESKSIGRGECLDAKGSLVPQNQGGGSPANCETTTVANTYKWQDSTPYASNFTASTPYSANFVSAASAFCRGASGNNVNQCTNNGGQWIPAQPASCTATSGPNTGQTYSAQNVQQCANAVGSSPNVCTITSGPNAGTYNNVYNNVQQCANFAGSSQPVCTATSGPNKDATYDAKNEQQCSAAVGTREVATGNKWVTAGDLFNSSAAAAVSRALTEDQQFGGFSIGYNFQTGRIVYGVEADFSWMKDGTSHRRSYSEVNLENVEGPGQSEVPLYTNVSTDAFAKFGVNRFATLRARLGYDFNDTILAFVTGGLAGGHVTMAGAVNYYADWGIGRGNNDPRNTFGETDAFSRSGWKWGYTLGAGVNYKFTENIILGLTYLYVDLGKFSASSEFAFNDSLSRNNDNPNAQKNSFQAAGSGSAKARLDASFHTVRLGAQIRFATGGAASPVAAAY